MKREYNHKEIEEKWQKAWVEKGIYKSEEDAKKPKSYVLDMFPYPSGEGLHVGHPKGYIATDIYSRFKRMNGHNVLHPMGWDAFGLPAENYAIKTKTHPREAVEKNIVRYKEQLSGIGFNYDWDREINTTDPEYYRWTQWAFLQMYKKGLAFQSNDPINWCPSCQTGLANEDLDDGKCERCGSVVEKRPMRQWVLKITDYAERLLSDLDSLNWPESVKESQRNWIGKSEGAEISFKTKDSGEIKVFTTRPDTIFGATYLVLSPEHEFIKENQKSISNFAEVVQYIEKTKGKTEIERTAVGKEKTGVELKGVTAINPTNNEEIPVWIADYVLTSYGTGAIMAVPAHDERDFEFAQKFNLPINEVVIPNIVDRRNPPVAGKKVVERQNVHAIVRDPKTKKYLALQWKQFDWLTFPMGGVEEGEKIAEAAKREVLEETGFKNLKLVRVIPGQVRAEYFAAHKDENRVAYTTAVVFELINDEREKVSAKERDAHEVVWIDESKINYENMTHAEADVWKERMKNSPTAYTGTGFLISSGSFSGQSTELVKKAIVESVGGKLVTKYKLRDWVFSRQRYWGEPIPLIHCEKCGVVSVPEKDLPVRLPDVKNYQPTGTGESPLAAIEEWVNVECPKCGGRAKRETNTMPQWAGSCWYYLRYMDPKNKEALVDPKKEKYWAPVDVYVGGAEHATRHLIYARFWHKFLFDIGVVSTNEPFTRLYNVGLILAEDGRKMSKRYGNVINPDDIVATYGADTFRIYEMFMGPFTQASAWDTKSIMGSRRFVERVWRLSDKVSPQATSNKKLETILHSTIKKVTSDIETFNFNTAISSLMILSRELEEAEQISVDNFRTFLQLVAPFAPHATDELWTDLGNTNSIHESEWPAFDPTKIVSDTAKIIVQINGKVRDEFETSVSATEKEVTDQAVSSEIVKKWLTGATIEKIVYVKGRLVNIVTSQK